METILSLDKTLFLFLNGLHATWLDPMMIQGTETIWWFPIHLIWASLVIRYKKWDSIYVFLCIILTITMADQLTSGVMKPFFARLRPSHEPALAGLVHLVDQYKGGVYGFPSSHAANSFSVAILLVLLLKRIYPLITLMFLWAFVVSYTRIYLGVHYPSDVLVGWFIGVICGIIGFYLIPVLQRIGMKIKPSG